jgi:probable selenium-dependent hydroxylase accessory protein YqeC
LFAELFDFRLPALVNFVGGGGKTGLILQLQSEYAESSTCLYTTTTRIHPPDTAQGALILSASNTGQLKLLIESIARHQWANARKLVATRLEMAPGLLSGIPPDFADGLDRDIFPLILNEADGARSMSLKMPRPGEPILMENADYLVPVIGLDCLEKPLGPETLFRWKMAESRFALRAGEIITPELAGSLLLHPEGVCREWHLQTRIIPFINKVDYQKQDALAQALAQSLLNNGNFPIERVVWGSLDTMRAAVATNTSR